MDTSKAAAGKTGTATSVSDSIARALRADSIDAAASKSPTKLPAKKAATKECLLDMSESPPETRFTMQHQSDSSTNIFVGGGFSGRCIGEKNTIRADSIEYFQQAGFVNLFGNVVYEETKEFRVTSNHATYLTRDGKLYADGNVHALQLKSGSEFSGPRIEYFRVMPEIRPVSRLYAPENPTVRLLQKDSAGRDLPPVTVGANIMQDSGDSLLFAWGNVTMVRTDITGKSDSAAFDKVTGKARLIRAANIASVAKEQQFTLAGDTIDLFTKEQVLERVFALHLARARSGDVNMSAERLDLRLTDKKIDRAYAFGAGRAKAEAADQSLEADSMDIRLPGQRIQELRAHGRAVAVGKPDTTKIRSDERDELRGDTVIAVFDTARTPGDTSSKAVIRQVTAGGNASSKVQVASRDGPNFLPAINYLRGKHLVVSFDSGQVRNVAVDSSASGIYIEPFIDTTADSSKARRPARRPPLASAPRAILQQAMPPRCTPDPRQSDVAPVLVVLGPEPRRPR